MAPAVQIVTEEEIELFGTGSDGETFYGDLSVIGLKRIEETRHQMHRENNIEAEKSEVMSVGEGSAAESNGRH